MYSPSLLRLSIAGRHRAAVLRLRQPVDTVTADLKTVERRLRFLVRARSECQWRQEAAHIDDRGVVPTIGSNDSLELAAGGIGLYRFLLQLRTIQLALGLS